MIYSADLAMGDGRDSRYSGRQRAGRNTTTSSEAYQSELGLPRQPSRLEPDATGIAAGLDGFHQPTAMFDRGELLGDLAEELADPVPSTRADVEAEAPPKGFRLIIVAGPDIGTEWAFKGSKHRVTIGRGSENELDFPDIAVSRHHATIELVNTQFFLKDEGSNNGTLLNGVAIEREALCSGDEIVIGARSLRFVELNVTPATAAAHPILPGREPGSGRDSEIAAALDGLGSALGDVDIGDVPDAGGPSLDGGASSSSLPAPPPKPKRTGLKLVGLGLVGLVVVGGLGFMGLRVWQHTTGNTPEQRALRARTELLQGIELVRQLRCGDAIVLFERVLEVEPDAARPKAYVEHCRAEIEVWRGLEAAKALAGAARWEEAVEALDKVPAESGYRPEADRLAEAWGLKLADAKVAEARRLYDAGDVDGALELLNEVLARFPGHRGALAAKEAIEAMRRPTAEPKLDTGKKPEIPPLMERAVALYHKGQIAAAIDAAEAAGGADAQVWSQRMKRMRGLLDELARAHRLKAAAEVLKTAPIALELDKQIGLGRGEVRGRIRDIYADGLYLKGMEAYTTKDYGTAYKLLTEATQVQPGHKLSETTLAEVARRARELYYEGYVQKDSNAAETRRIFRTVKEMTPRSNQFHKWASDWLSRNGG